MGFFDKMFGKNNSDSGTFKETYILALVHKLRTPLNGARWALDMALKNNECKDRDILNEGYNKIIDSINTVSEILKSAELNTDGNFSNFRKEKINICIIIEDILKSLEFLVQEKQINLVYEYKCDPITIYGDKKMLELGLTNIFDNAFRYSPKGTVSVFLAQDGNMAKLIVKDSGIGISKEDLKNMFGKFYRGKNAREMDPTQSGVGLFATKKIVEMHKGNIKIESELGKGTTVEVKLPVD